MFCSAIVPSFCVKRFLSLPYCTCSIKEIVRLTFDTMRENYKAVPVPHAVAKLLGQPREYLKKYVSPFRPAQNDYAPRS
jgi:hypothetical protein